MSICYGINEVIQMQVETYRSKAKETNASGNMAAQSQIKDVWFEMYTWLEIAPQSCWWEC